MSLKNGIDINYYNYNQKHIKMSINPDKKYIRTTHTFIKSEYSTTSANGYDLTYQVFGSYPFVIGNDSVVKNAYKINFDGSRTEIPKTSRTYIITRESYINDQGIEVTPDQGDPEYHITVLYEIDMDKLISLKDFFRGTGITSVDFSELDTKYVTSLENLFLDCKYITDIDISMMDLSNVTNMTFTFSCNTEESILKNINISNVDLRNVTTFKGTFRNCVKLSNINFSGIKTSKKVSDCYSMFNNCQSIEDLWLEWLDTSNVTNMDYFFGGLTTTPAIKNIRFGPYPVSRASINKIFGGASDKEGVVLEYPGYLNYGPILSIVKDKWILSPYEGESYLDINGLSRYNQKLQDKISKVNIVAQTALDQINASSEKINKIDTLDSSISSINSEIGSLKTKTDNTNNSLNDLSSTVNTLNTDFTQVRSDCSTNKSDISGLKTKTDNTNNSLNDLSSTVNTLNTDFTQVKSDCSTNKSDISGLKILTNDLSNEWQIPVFNCTSFDPTDTTDVSRTTIELNTTGVVGDIYKHPTKQGFMHFSNNYSGCLVVHMFSNGTADESGHYNDYVFETNGIIYTSTLDIYFVRIEGSVNLSTEIPVVAATSQLAKKITTT